MSYAAEAPISAELCAKALVSDVELDDIKINLVRQNFGLFRREIRPHMIWGWWTQEVAWQLHRFYNDMVAGRRPKLAISSPPQHGKSWAATDFIAWVAGKQPDRKTIFGSYSDDLGVRTNNDLQRIITGEPFKRIFPGTKISEEATSSGGYDRWKRNSSLIEFIGHEGSFRNTTVSGQINGLELHLGVIDDPIKGREEAHRVNARNKAWEWFADDFMSRFAKDAALLVVMTRWHTDDILGRFMERYPELRMLSYPAIAEHDERCRRKGDPLFPELKPLDFLLDRSVYADRVTGHKEVRADPFAAQVQGGNVHLVAGEWVSAYLDELEVFPSGKWKDQVDASSGAFNKLAGTGWVRAPIEEAAFSLARTKFATKRGDLYVSVEEMEGDWGWFV
jgi:hypothetical protein